MSGRLKFIQSLKGSSSPKNSDANSSGTPGVGDSGYTSQQASDEKHESSEQDAAGSSSARPAGRGQMLMAAKQSAIESPNYNSYELMCNVGRGRNIQMLKAQLATEAEKSPPLAMSNVKQSLPAVAAATASVTETTSGIESEYYLPPNILGTCGTPVPVVMNYMPLHCEADRGIFCYEVMFNPAVDAKRTRFELLKQHSEAIGRTRTFDGRMLYLPHMLPNSSTVYQCVHPNDGSQVQMKLLFIRKQRMYENAQFYNVLFRRVMKHLNLVEMGRNHFDPSMPHVIPQQHLEIWPGFVSSIEEFDGGLMLSLDVSHRVLCQKTVLDHISEIARSSPRDLQRIINKSLLGSVVLTRYNNRTYRIDEVLFDENPMSTFSTSNGPTTYVDYYKQQYNITIRDVKQPMLVNRISRRITGQSRPEEIMVCLIPEICYLTGLSDEMRNNLTLMREVAGITRVTPTQRVNSMRKFCENVNGNDDARKLLHSWGLRLAIDPLELTARFLGEQSIIFGNRQTIGSGVKGEFGNQVGRQTLINPKQIRNWLLVYGNRDESAAKELLKYIRLNCNPLGMSCSEPNVARLSQDTPAAYVECLRQSITPETQIVVVITPTQRGDMYAAIKRICCVEIPVPSQVIHSRTMRNVKESKTRSIVQKILLQMNCKLGGSLWSVNIPLENVMICGIDTYHEGTVQCKSVAAIVASLDRGYTRWYSSAIIQNRREELLRGLCNAIVDTLNAYRKMNGCLPEKLIVYRDGVGNGQLATTREFEISQIRNAFLQIDPNYTPKITFLVIQKRIITRIFQVDGNELRNPDPGTVLDHTITKRKMFDFYLVPQSVHQGTVAPTHYIVLHDESNYKADILQRLSYRLCYMYYNFAGSIRVPACCQYAHKMAYLIGQSVKRNPDKSLCDKLFYL